MFLQILTLHISLIVIYVSTVPYKHEYNAPGYGEEWILVDDDDGNTHLLNFSSVPNDTRGLMYGDAYYYLYTRQNNEPEELFVPSEDQAFTSQYFNSSNLIKIVTHGWLGSKNTTWLQSMKSEFITKEDYNVIIIDWSELSLNPNYPWAAFSTRYIGKKTAKLIDAIATAHNVNGSNIHLLGHSLGSQVMAYTAMFSNLRIQRITGLDPARPFFEVPTMPDDCRLDKTDAEFVDIIHTSGGLLGYEKSHGHADFYPNDGRPIQPGCKGIRSAKVACSHGRSNLFFIESINGQTLFNAYPCESWEKFENGECKDNFTYMGYQATIPDSGNFYLYTNAETPFAQGDAPQKNL